MWGGEESKKEFHKGLCFTPPITHTCTHTFRSTVEFAREVAETKVMDDALDRLDEMVGSSGSHDTFSPPRVGSALPPQGRELVRVCTKGLVLAMKCPAQWETVYNIVVFAVVGDFV